MPDNPDDLEILALTKVRQALDPLDVDAQRRVIEWASKRFSVPLPTSPEEDTDGKGAGPQGRAVETLPTLGELFAAAAPKTDPERALVGAYWHQVRKGNEAFESQPVNTELKNLGYGVGNITDAIDSLKVRKPALVVQLQKRGTSKQGRKSFKITEAGINFVKKMVSEGSESTS